MSDNTLGRFRYLFRGRTDAWGHVEGKSVQQELTDVEWTSHLYGSGSIGVYPLVKTPSGFRVAWGCTDIDMKENPEGAWPLALNMQKALQALGITSWIERTKSKGYHVWVFVEGWVAAESMRNALLVAHQVAGVAPVEVNPKQTADDHLKRGMGNYVNLPYAKAWTHDGRRCVVCVNGGLETAAMPLDVFVEQAMGSLNDPSLIGRVAEMYVPPPPPPKVAIECDDVELAPLVGRLPGLAFTIFQNGVLDGRDRSGTLQRLAHLIAESEAFTPSECFALLADADSRWGKFYDRADGAEQLERMVSNAWGKRPTEGR